MKEKPEKHHFDFFEKSGKIKVFKQQTQNITLNSRFFGMNQMASFAKTTKVRYKGIYLSSLFDNFSPFSTWQTLQLFIKAWAFIH